MVKIGVVSDSHGRQIMLEMFADKCRAEGYDYVFHLGDTRDDAKWLERNLSVPLISVAGNCDAFSRHQREVRPTFEGHRFIAVHGDGQSVKYGYERLSYYAEDAGAEVALFGHTHQQFIGWVGSVLLINPGALRNGHYAEIILEGKDIIPRGLNLNDSNK
ncbi:MAG: YfcE family phosphodiesterase [Clostridia bacterium]|nr:YfcE family phosphodiesterase [Clostridia bacterium]